MLYKLFIVALIASAEIYVAIATGMAFKFSSLTLFLTTLVGGIAGVFVSVYLGHYIKAFFLRFKKPKPENVNEPPSKKVAFLINLRNKYGIFGLGFIGTFLMGAPISIGIAVSLGLQPKQLLKWCLLAVLIRCFVYAYFFNFIKSLF
jgi:Ca2+/H+ antiporter, TMEM165/GDT1 family